MQRAGASLRSFAEPVVDTTSDFDELVLTMFGVAAKLERRRIAERTAQGRAAAKTKGSNSAARPSLTPHSSGRRANVSPPRRDTMQRRPQLQCQSGDDITSLHQMQIDGQLNLRLC